MSQSTIQQLAQFGQSVWLDYISRPMLENGDLKIRIENGLRGMTSNPAIFNKAIGSSSDYDKKISELKNSGKSTFQIYDELTVNDIQDAADIFKSVYVQSQRLDGYVSLEINPLLASKVDEQIEEGVRLWEKVKRQNVMIKVPATDQGVVVVEELISRGINVNTTLIFSLDQYLKTVKAYINGLKKLSKTTDDLSSVRSVASVFVSRIDSAVDKLLDEKNADNKLKGKAAVANCRMIFEAFKIEFDAEEFKALEEKGANIQRVLWASTSTKNPAYSDIKYVTELITAPTVNTIPQDTLDAFSDHGEVAEAFDEDPSGASDILAELQSAGVDMDQVCQKLLIDGCAAFDEAFEVLLQTIEKKAEQLVA